MVENSNTCLSATGHQTIKGFAGDGQLKGGSRNESATPEDNNDRIFGQDGGHTLAGNAGNDTLTGRHNIIAGFDAGRCGGLSEANQENDDFLDLDPFYSNILMCAMTSAMMMYYTGFFWGRGSIKAVPAAGRSR